MSLLKRIESARPGSNAPAAPGAPGVPGSNLPAVPGGPPSAPAAPRLQSQAPVRESFRDVKFRIQNRVIQDLDPKLDLSNQVEVRRQIEEIFGKVIDEEGLALTRAERVRRRPRRARRRPTGPGGGCPATPAPRDWTQRTGRHG